LPQLELPDPYDGVEYDCQAEEVDVDNTEDALQLPLEAYPLELALMDPELEPMDP